jgi:hypothetical protein
MKRLCQFLPRRSAPAALTPQQQEDHVAHMYLGNMFLSLGDYTRAEAEYSRAHAVFPSNESKRQLALIQMRRFGKTNLSASSQRTSRAA